MNRITKTNAKPTVNGAIALTLLTKLGIGILKQSANADTSLNGQDLTDEVLSSMLLANINNEVSKEEIV